MAARARTESASRVSGCVTALLRDQPFFGSLALRLPIRPDPVRETLASDGREIRYSPDWVAGTDADLIKTAIGRVVLACALKHHTRRGERDPGRWQQASQLVTHGLLRDAGFKLPPEAEAWDGISVEQAYDRLPEPQEGGGEGSDGPPSAGDGGGAGGPQPDADDDDASEDEDNEPQGQEAQGENAHDDGNPGGHGESSDDGEPQPGDDSSGDNDSGMPPSCDPSGTGEVMDAPAGSSSDAVSGQAPPDVSAEEQTWDEAMHQALNLAKAQGKAPGAVEETVRDAHRSTLDWRSLLRRYMTDAAARDYSWSVPNRRFIDSGLYLPSIRSEGMGTLAVIIDTSGSVDSDALAAFWSEVRELAAEIEPDRIVVLQVDAAVQDEEHYTPGELPERIVVKGRWGTDFRPGFERLAEQGIRPAVCLYFTDMDCDRYPETEPDYPVAWIDYSPAAGLSPEPPPWGEHIRIDG
ncbi:MAG: VWA-like domain-containing protein [Rhodospirillaceae bacterium]|nr:VWA-like domain-containing protein [Rhodospirillaceae bacterium]